MLKRPIVNNSEWQILCQRLDQQSLSFQNRPGRSRFLGEISYLIGTLYADHFTIEPTAAITVVSGNGNVDYGCQEYDLLDLSHLPISTVETWLDATQQGMLFNPGNGTRLFDAIILKNGQQIIFEGLDIVQFADATINLSVCPNDPEFNQQWNLHIMGVHNAWRFTQGNPEILIGIQDTGLAYQPLSRHLHPDLVEPISLPQNIQDDFACDLTNLFCRARFSSHGTRVHSIISAVSNNGEGMSGINWKASVAHVDVLGGDAEDMNIAQATDFMLEIARQQGQRLVVNMSLCDRTSSPAFDALVEQNKDNALFVVAAGNNNQDEVAYPASLAKDCNNAIAVGAVSPTQRHSAHPIGRTIYDCDHGSNHGSGLSLMGPAEVLTATAVPERQSVQFDYHSNFGGTSAAAPNVAGVASLVWGLYPQFSAGQVHQILADTAYRLSPADRDAETGHGLVDAETAVRRALALSRSL